MNFAKNSAQRGFTLIELLLVIVILGILAGTVITVINPAAQQDKAKEGVMKSNLDKIATAMNACASSRVDPYNKCDSIGEIGIVSPNGNPSGASYEVDHLWGTTLRTYTSYLNTDGNRCYYYIYLNITNFTTSKGNYNTSYCRGGWE